MDSRRAEAFSDGVFAVAITLLVIDLLPIGRGQDLTYHRLSQHWPQYAAYVVSFLTIGIMWLNHHTMLSLVSRVDRTTLVLNILLLMGIVLVPFPTALVAEHLGAGAPSGGALAAVVYGIVMIAISLAYATLWLYMSAHGEKLGARQPAKTPRAATLRFTGGLVGYVAGTVIAAVGLPGVALAIYGLIAVYYLFEHLPNPALDGAGANGAGPGQAGLDGAGLDG